MRIGNIDVIDKSSKVEDRKIIYPRGKGWKVLRQNIAIQFLFQRLRVLMNEDDLTKLHVSRPLKNHLEMHM